MKRKSIYSGFKIIWPCGHERIIDGDISLLALHIMEPVDKVRKKFSKGKGQFTTPMSSVDGSEIVTCRVIGVIKKEG